MAIIGAIVRRITRALSKSSPATAATKSTRAVAIRPMTKPNKVIRPKPTIPKVRVVTGSSRTSSGMPSSTASTQAERTSTGRSHIPRPGDPGGGVQPVPRINIPTNAHPGNQAAPDLNSASTYGVGRGADTPVNDLSKLATAIHPGEQGDRGALASSALQAGIWQTFSQTSSYIPSINWVGGVSARGFKTTPLRTVLHYCLAAVFGLVHQARMGSTSVKVELYPTENRVEVHFTNASSILMEPANLVASKLSSQIGSLPTDVTPREIGDSLPIGLIPGGGALFQAGADYIKQYLDGDNPPAALQDVKKEIADASRLFGAGGIWDMAQSNIFAGDPPVTMQLPKAAPFTDMLEQSKKFKKPMLTRSLAFNPQAPNVVAADGKKMNYPTFFDLRSLVAQALYDPGVLPPPPDTYVALPDVDLP